MTNKELRERTCSYADESGSLHVELKEEARFPDLHVPRVKRSEGSDTTPTSHVQKVLRTE